MVKNSFEFTPSTVNSLKLQGNKQDIYYDSHKKTAIPNCRLQLVVGSKSKTYYLVFRKNVNGKSSKRLIKLGSHPTLTISLARDKFLIDAQGLNKIKGIPFSTNEIVEAIQQKVVAV